MIETSPAAPGREDELGAIAQALAARRPVVLAITGPNGSGKSYVTSRAVRAARLDGWRFTPYRDGRGVRVGTSTTAEELAAEITLQLGLPAPAGADRRRPLQALADVLVSAAATGPVGVVLDPYLPGPDLAEEIRRRLLPAVRSAGRPVALVFVARRALDEELEPDLALEVEPPGSDGIERTLRQATADLVPPVEGAELAVYVDAARRNPRLLTSLELLLPLAGPSATGGPNAPTLTGSATDGATVSATPGG